MEERSENGEKIEEIMLPGFRFHPTDEELVGFYLKRKIQQRPLSIELIKQLDIYKHDPWDLPKLAMTGEKEWYFYCQKEWYFYCPRDRKYRNSARPNRVTGAGFWKATGTDRPIYASEGSKCIGLKKSLVFYKGRAAKGVKTDWMMHEFRLPSLTDHTTPSKRFLEKTIPANDAWAICRIFKKASSTAQRTLSHSWVSPILQETPSYDHNILTQHGISSNDLQHSSITSFSANVDLTSRNMSLYKPFNIDQTSPTLTTINKNRPQNSISSSEDLTYSTSYPCLFQEPNYGSKSSTVDVSSLLVNMPNSIFGDFDKSGGLDYITNGLHHDHQQYYNGCCFSITNLPMDVQENCVNNIIQDHEGPAGVTTMNGPTDDGVDTCIEDQWGRSPNGGYPFLSLPLGLQDAWKSSFLCDSSSEISSGFSTTNKCYV